MKIIQSHNKRSKEVKKWSDVSSISSQMKKLLNAGNFPGLWKEGLALSHCQVAEEPMNFFVLHKGIKDTFSGFDVICNARIVECAEEVRFKEACMSFPFRQLINTKRYSRVVIEAEVRNPLKFFGSVLSTRQFTLEGLAAFIVQHEIDHAKGINIYDRFKK